MASSRRLPTTSNTSTYDSAGGKDYTTLQAWEEATDIDLTAGGQSAGEILEVYKGAHADRDNLDGATTDTSYFRVIKPASGEGHLDISPGIPAVDGSMAAFVSVINGNMLDIREANSQIQDIVGKLTLNVPQTRMIFKVSLIGFLVGCMAIDGANAGDGTVNGFSLVSGGGTINCLAHNCDGIGFFSGVGGGFSYNCSAESNLNNFDETGGTVLIIKNGLANNPNGGSDYNGTPIMTTCGSSDGTGSAGLQNQNYTFVSAGGDDFHYTSGSDGIGDGTDLSGDGTYAFDDDTDGDTRSSWDIGFDEFVAVGINYDVSMTLAASFGISQSGMSNALASLTIANYLGISNNAIATALGSLTLSQNLGMSQSALAATLASITYSSNYSISQSASVSALAALTVSFVSAFSSTGKVDALASLVLNAQSGISSSIAIDRKASLTLAAEFGISSNAQAETKAGLTLSQLTGIAAIGKVVALAGLTLSNILSIEQTATMTIGRVITPDERLFTITIESRHFTVEEEDRYFLVPEEDRHFEN